MSEYKNGQPVFARYDSSTTPVGQPKENGTSTVGMNFTEMLDVMRRHCNGNRSSRSKDRENND